MRKLITASCIIFVCTLTSCGNGSASNTTEGTNATNATEGTINADSQRTGSSQSAAGVGYDSVTSGNVGGGSTGTTGTQPGNRADNTGSGRATTNTGATTTQSGR